MKREIAHTTNFAELQALCMQLGNTTLPLLRKGKNLNYLSKQTMGEMVAAIGVALEMDILQEICQSPYFSIIIDEATDISVTKSLGLCIQYLDSDANVRVRAVKLIEVSHGTADAITDSLFTYLTTTAPVPLEQEKLAGGASDGASVMVGPITGVVARIKTRVPLYVSTHCVAHRLSLAAVDACAHSHLCLAFSCLSMRSIIYFHVAVFVQESLRRWSKP